MSRPLEGRTAVVTGGGKGLGRAFALHLAELGASVVVNNRNRVVDADGLGPADHVVREIEAAGGRAVAQHGDVVDPATPDALVQTALEHFGRLDICVTSAGITRPQMLHKATAEEFRAVFEVNVMGTAMVASAVLAEMRRAGHGRLVLVASGAGLHGLPTASSYAASKGAVIALAKSAALEGAPKDVLTNVLLPYATTQMTEDGMDQQHADRMRPELVAPVVGALADPTSTINGEIVIAAGSAVRVADSVEGGTVLMPHGAPYGPTDLADALHASRARGRHVYPHAPDAFQAIAADLVAAGL